VQRFLQIAALPNEIPGGFFGFPWGNFKSLPNHSLGLANFSKNSPQKQNSELLILFCEHSPAQ
jgi:hypothetical protein